MLPEADVGALRAAVGDVREPTTMQVIATSRDVRGARNDAITVGVEFDVTIHNPTTVDVEIEDNHIDVRQRGALIASTRLPRGRVAAGATEKVRVAVPLTIAPSQVPRIRELITAKDWTITLYLEVADGFTFPVYLLTRS